MRTFKKILLSIGIFTLSFCGLSWAAIQPYLSSKSAYYHDEEFRKQLSGQIDFVTIGASHALSGFVPAVLDSELDCNSYNLSISMIPMHARYAILEKEFSRNNIDTVVLEVSYDTLVRQVTNEYGMGEEPTIVRLGAFADRARYMFEYVSVDDWLNVYSHLFVEGVCYIGEKVTGNEMVTDFSQKGFKPKESNDVTIPPEELKIVHETNTYANDFYKESYEMFLKTINLCHENGARVIIAVVPVSDSQIWRYSNLEDFLEWGNSFAKEYDCEFYDFNLIRSRYDKFSDVDSYTDEEHLSESGAITFTKLLADVIKKTNSGVDVGTCFFGSYEEVRRQSPYQL